MGRHNAHQYCPDRRDLNLKQRQQRYDELKEKIRIEGFNKEHPIEVFLNRTDDEEDKILQGHHCLTETHAIEYDWGKKWAESLGQALYYSAMTGKKPGIVLIVNSRTKDRYLTRLNKAIEAHALDVDVWTVEKQ
jgi:hypothetical protein